MTIEIPSTFPSDVGAIGNQIDNSTLTNLIAAAAEQDGKNGYRAAEARLKLEELLERKGHAAIETDPA